MDLDQLHTDIERYLREEMAPAEQQAFESRMEAEPAVKKEVLLHVLAEEAISQKIEEDVRTNMNAIREEYPLPESVPLWKQPALRVAAAVAVVLVLIGSFFLPALFSGGGEETQEQLIFALIENPVQDGERRGGSTEQEPWKECLPQFNDKQYRAAIDCFQKYDASVVEVQQYLAHAYLELKEFQQAERSFEQVLAEAKAESEAATDAGYHLLLIHAIQGKPGVLPQIDRLLQDPRYRHYENLQQLKSILAEQPK